MSRSIIAPPSTGDDDGISFTGLSPSVSIERGEAPVGRHGVATAEIAIGEVVLSERPIACALFRAKFDTNCLHCFKPLLNIAPCRSCAEVAFCSPSCRDQVGAVYAKNLCLL